MNKSEIRVIVVEDDMTLSKAVGEAITRYGLSAVVCTNPTEALNQYRMAGADFFVIDCLLPKMSGVDLATKLRTDGAATTPVVLTSGIFKDKSFIKDSLQKTGALAFVSKPYNVKELLQIIVSSVEHLIDEEVSPLESLLISSPTPAEKIKVINQLEQIEAFDIPWLCCQLMNPSVSGILKLGHEKSPAAISFSKGKIAQVEMQNPESFFGALLIENGYLSPEQLNQALQMQSSKKIGERLVDLNYLSPHVIDLINAEQTAIRLSRIISDITYAVSFEERHVDFSASSIDTESLAPFLIDWINSKIQVSWLKQRYLKWLNSPTIRLQGQEYHRRIWSLPPLKSVPLLVAEFDKGASLGQVLEKAHYKEDLVYQVFHILILIDHLKLKKETRAVDTSTQTARLKKIWADMQNQDYFAVLGVGRNAKAADIKKMYYELAKIFHPDKIPGSANTELKDLAKRVFGKMTEAYDVLSNEQKKASHVKEIEMGRAEKILQAESIMEEGKAFLKSGQSAKAYEKFREAAAVKTPTSDLLVHLAWAELLNLESSESQDMLNDVESNLNRIPPEDRHNATYYFVKGLFQKIRGDLPAAKKNILHALSLKSKFIEAERILRVIDLQIQKGTKSTNVLHGDLKDVMGNLFKKR